MKIFSNWTWNAGRVALCAVLVGMAVSACSGNGKSANGGAGADEPSVSVPAATYQAENSFMNEAINQAREGIHAGHGGPFGSVIVKDGKIIGRGHNHVVSNNDPTCHGEVDAIRNACRELGTFDLSGCELYTTGEPCPMCLCACMWANITAVYYGCTIADNEHIGFRDARFDEMLGGREKMADYLHELDREACLQLFDEYNSISDRQLY